MNEKGSDRYIDVSAAQLADAIDELEREHALRERLYPGWLKAGTISRADARDRQQRLTWAVAALKRVLEAEGGDDVSPDCDALGPRAA